MYYTLTAEQAATIGKFEFAKNCFCDPFVCPQKDGTFLVGEGIYQIVSNNENILKVDFTKLSTTNTNNPKNSAPI